MVAIWFLQVTRLYVWVNNKEWTLVSSKKHIEKSNKRNKGEIVSVGHLITTTDRFTSLHNHDNQSDPWEGQECSEWTLSTKMYGKSENNIT
jgi:hypothetical protein